MVQVGVLSSIAVAMTFGVYGVVALIVKLDDIGWYLSLQNGTSVARALQRSMGQLILKAAPWLMKLLTTVGTLAMFLVGGGILTHAMHSVSPWVASVSQMAGGFAPVVLVGLKMFVGLGAGAITLATVKMARFIPAWIHKWDTNRTASHKNQSLGSYFAKNRRGSHLHKEEPPRRLR